MMPAYRRGMVRMDGTPAGVIAETESGFEFTYLPEWLANESAVPVSLNLPLRAEPYASKYLHPFFQNLLPEGWLLELAGKKLKIAKDDDFGMLLATCADCVGAAEIVAIDEVGSDE
jgi:serine/threonine-protein kinase HipA